MNNFPFALDLAANLIGVLCFIVLCWKYLFGFRKEFKEFRNWKNQRKVDQNQEILDVLDSTKDDLDIVISWLQKKQQEGNLAKSQLSKIRGSKNYFKVAFKLAIRMLKETLNELNKATIVIEDSNRVIKNRFVPTIQKLKVLIHDLMKIMYHNESLNRTKEEEIKRKYEIIIHELNILSSHLIDLLRYRDERKF